LVKWEKNFTVTPGFGMGEDFLKRGKIVGVMSEYSYIGFQVFRLEKEQGAPIS